MDPRLDCPILHRVVDREPQVHSGDLVFAGTRVPVGTLIDLLKRGRTIEDFIDGYPSLERWQLEAFLDLSPGAVEHLLRTQSARPPDEGAEGTTRTADQPSRD